MGGCEKNIDCKKIICPSPSKAGRLKGTGLGISADLPKSIVEARKKLISKFKAAKKDGKTAFFSRAEPDKLYINGVLISP